MAKKYADFVFGDDGTFEVDAIGFEGRECSDFTKPLEQVVGEVTERVAKPERHQVRVVPGVSRKVGT
jgi:hypothetical protein